MIQEIAPQVKGSAVVDDRTLRGPPGQVKQALHSIFEFDTLAGHITHPEKITLTACTPRDKRLLATWIFEGVQPKIVDTQRLVGDVVTTLRRGGRQLAEGRLDFAIRTAARIKAVECSAAAKRQAIMAKAIPRRVPSTLWTKTAGGETQHHAYGHHWDSDEQKTWH